MPFSFARNRSSEKQSRFCRCLASSFSIWRALKWFDVFRQVKTGSDWFRVGSWLASSWNSIREAVEDYRNTIWYNLWNMLFPFPCVSFSCPKFSYLNERELTLLHLARQPEPPRLMDRVVAYDLKDELPTEAILAQEARGLNLSSSLKFGVSRFLPSSGQKRRQTTEVLRLLFNRTRPKMGLDDHMGLKKRKKNPYCRPFSGVHGWGSLTPLFSDICLRFPARWTASLCWRTTSVSALRLEHDFKRRLRFGRCGNEKIRTLLEHAEHTFSPIPQIDIDR